MSRDLETALLRCYFGWFRESDEYDTHATYMYFFCLKLYHPRVCVPMLQGMGDLEYSWNRRDLIGLILSDMRLGRIWNRISNLLL